MVKSVLITGCSEGGIGDYLAREFHSKGLRIFATARDLKKIEHLRVMGLDVLPLDVVSPESVETAVKSVKDATGGTLDFLVNNSGGGYGTPLLDAKIDVAKKLFDLNFFALLAVTQAFTPLLIAAKGKVINIGSVVGFLPIPFMGIYNASKAAVNLLSDSLRVELAPFGVKVITVVAGVVRTRFVQNQSGDDLSKDSLYYPVRAKAEHTMNGVELAKTAMEPPAFAAKVVANALKSTPNPRIWVGTGSWMIWFITTFLPHTFADG